MRTDLVGVIKSGVLIGGPESSKLAFLDDKQLFLLTQVFRRSREQSASQCITKYLSNKLLWNYSLCLFQTENHIMLILKERY